MESGIAMPSNLDSKAAQVLHLRPKPETQSSGNSQDSNATAQINSLAEAYERFQLQIRLDVEEERELLYKSLLVVEVLVLLFVVREFLVRSLS